MFWWMQKVLIFFLYFLLVMICLTKRDLYLGSNIIDSEKLIVNKFFFNKESTYNVLFIEYLFC